MKYWLIFGTSMMFSCLDFLKEEPEEEEEEGDSDPEEGAQAGDCLDGIDNDEDGHIDCEDQGCDGKPACESDDTGVVDTGEPDDTGDTDTDTDTDTDDEIPTVSVQDIQTGDVDEGQYVRIENAIVTTEITPDGEGFFIQDAGGGEWSGIYVYTMQGESPSVGDEITMTGIYSEFYDFSQLVLEFESEYEVTGSGQPVTTTITSPSGDWESYEGCLVRFNDQGVVSAMNSHGEVELAMGIPMTNLFFDFSADYGGHYDSVTGVISYQYEEFKINPRAEADLVGYVYESTPVTIPDIQAGSYTHLTVTLEDVIVTAVDASGNFWVQESGGGEWAGLFVYTSSLATNVNIGDVLTITGEISEYYDLTEMTISSLSDISQVTAVQNPTTTSISAPPSDWENYESVLVSLQNVEIGSAGSYGDFELVNYPGMLVDDQLHNYALLEGNTISSLSGIVYYSYGEFKILPRDGDDVVGIQ